MANLQYILPFLGVVFSALISLVINRASKSQRDADAASKLSDAAASLFEPTNSRIDSMEEEIKELREEIKTLRAKVTQLRKGVRILHDQVKGAGLIPLWKPEDEDL
jgi:peptidoglycan hydrolase CwlO-like protein